ncbi:hypothetical protein, partial [Rhizobium sp. WYCCWR10014]|uniref:hypothetical protein n=1 Tax=Rhizobium sp. WYCCWR10014 TaxID=1825933 RepID=UPI001AEC8150
QCLQQIAHRHGESSTIITVKTKLAPMGLDPSIHGAASPSIHGAAERQRNFSKGAARFCVHKLRKIKGRAINTKKGRLSCRLYPIWVMLFSLTCIRSCFNAT